MSFHSLEVAEAPVKTVQNILSVNEIEVLEMMFLLVVMEPKKNVSEMATLFEAFENDTSQ